MCGCVPWTHPNPGSVRLCHHGEIRKCFDKVMASPDHGPEQCDCPNNCDDVTYEYSVLAQVQAKYSYYFTNLLCYAVS